MLLAFQHRHRAHQRSHRPRDPPLAANHLTQVFAADTQPQHGRIAIIANDTHLHRVGIIDEIAREKFNQPLQ